jgi:hypothetical protein
MKTNDEHDWQEAPIPQNFKTLAKRFDMTWEQLAFSILSYFADHPEKFCLVSNDPADARRYPSNSSRWDDD